MRKGYKIVLAKDYEGNPEIEHTLYPHTGDEGQEQDLKIFAFADTIPDSGDMSSILSMPEYREIACLTLDLDPTGELYNSLSTIELFKAFMEGLAFRTGQLNNAALQEAIKK